MSYLLLAAIVAFVIYIGMRWFVTADPARLKFVAATFAITVVAVVALLLIFTGRVGSLYMLGLLVGPALMAWYRRRKAAAGGFGDPGGTRAGPRSEAEGEWLRMDLDLQSGRLDGTVKLGPYAGRRLSDLDEEQLLALARACGADADSTRLIGAYLDRRLGMDWRDRARADSGRASSTAMTREEALDVLGLEPNATQDEIRAAHRRLMAQMHPDRGGSTYLAAKINQARDFLLRD